MMNSTINLEYNKLTEAQIRAIREEEINDEMERNKWKRYFNTIKRHWPVYVMLIPVIIFFFLFKYRPIGELLVAFKRYNPATGVSLWDEYFYGFYSFKNLMFGPQSDQFWQAFRNTFTLSTYGLLFGFPIPIILALLFSEIRSDRYRSVTQILAYLPKFLSTVVITSIIGLMLYAGSVTVAPGFLTNILVNLGAIQPGVDALTRPAYFRSIYIISDMWEGAGYGSIVYFAAIMAISPTYYEAARIDGANKLAQIRYVTLPGMAPTLTIMLILRIGSILSIGYEKIILLTGAKGNAVLETAEVLSTYVLRMGSLIASEGQGIGPVSTRYALATGADLFNSFIAMFLVLGANFVARRVSDTSLF